MTIEDIINLMREAQHDPVGGIKESEYYNSLKNREIWIDEDVADETFTLNVARQIINWNREDELDRLKVSERKPIIVYIFTMGGDLDICNSIIDVISCSKTPVYTVNMGRSLSAGAYIFLAGHKRFMLPQSYFLFHQGKAKMEGTPEEIKRLTDLYYEQVEELSEKMKKYTKYTEEEIDQKIKQEWYVRADEALEKGVADKIIISLNELIFN